LIYTVLLFLHEGLLVRISYHPAGAVLASVLVAFSGAGDIGVV